jgi:hypothetical protein
LLEGVISLFKSPKVPLAASIHILAFDLLAGLYIRGDAAQHAINRALQVPIYLLTLMFRPAGLLACFAPHARLVP